MKYFNKNKKNILNKREQIFNLIVCLILFCLSGTIQFSYIWYKESLIFISLISIGIVILLKKIKLTNVITLSLLSLLIIINLCLYKENIDGHICLILKLIISCIFINYINFELFKKYYINLVFVLSIISLICFFIFVIRPDIILNNIPSITYWNHVTKYIGVYNFSNNIYTIRNFGPFHEAGMWAVFVDVALLLQFQKNKNNKFSDKLKIFIFIITIITTFSTTGFIVCIIILFNKLLLKPNAKTIFICILCISFLIISEMNFGIISNKLDDNNISYSERMSEFGLFVKNFGNSPILGVGYQNNSHISSTELENATNGILSIFLQFGLLGGSIIFMFYIRGIWNISHDFFDFFMKLIIIILFFMSEPTAFKPMFMCLLFIDKNYKFRKGNNNYENSISSSI